MYKYNIKGDTYDTIAVDQRIIHGGIQSTHYYTKDGVITGQANVIFVTHYEADSFVLDSIKTDATGTVVLPKTLITVVGPYALRGVGFKRLVIPKGVKLTLKKKSLYGSDTVTEFITLSRDIQYEDDVFPLTITRRLF